jgi:small subunit ribosomal protein S17
MDEQQTQKNNETGATQDTMGKVLRGVVVSDKMKDTAVVRVEQYKKHAKYKKFIKRSKKYAAHDAGNTVAVGDLVSIEECRPISKRKHFKVVKK